MGGRIIYIDIKHFYSITVKKIFLKTGIFFQNQIFFFSTIIFLGLKEVFVQNVCARRGCCRDNAAHVITPKDENRK